MPETNSKLAVEVGSTPPGPIICTGSAENSMTSGCRNRRGIFGRNDARGRGGTYIFRKIEQVKDSEGVVKFSAPKDTEVTARWERILDPSPSRSVEFGKKYF